MPYAEDGSTPPPAVTRRIKSEKGRRQWAKVWNSVYKRTGDEGAAFRTAWGVTKKAGYNKDPNESLLSRLYAMESGFAWLIECGDMGGTVSDVKAAAEERSKAGKRAKMLRARRNVGHSNDA